MAAENDIQIPLHPYDQLTTGDLTGLGFLYQAI